MAARGSELPSMLELGYQHQLHHPLGEFADYFRAEHYLECRHWKPPFVGFQYRVLQWNLSAGFGPNLHRRAHIKISSVLPVP
jgi:hypothetical protein